MRKKLEPLGCAKDGALVGRFVDHLLEGGSDGMVELGDEFDGVLPEDAVLEFDDADLAELERVVAEYQEGFPDLMASSARAAPSTMLRRYKKEWTKWRPHALAEMDRFKGNIEGRSGKAFDLPRMFIELSRDQGSFQDRHDPFRTTGIGAPCCRPAGA